jgi:hypothetical protein
VKKLCSLPTRSRYDKTHFTEVNAAQKLAAGLHWDILSMMITYVPQIPVTVPGKLSLADGTLVGIYRSVLEIAERNGAPRPLLLRLKALGKQQQEDAKRTKVSAAFPVAPTNTFEDPTSKVLTEAEEKKKAKKREQKKKAKAKKKAAAAARKEGYAGAGKEEGHVSSTDSDSSGPDDEEEGMDEEERMLARAPTFDLEKEKAARKARAEAEAEKEKKTKE